MPVPKSWIFFFLVVVAIVVAIVVTGPEGPTQTESFLPTIDDTARTTFSTMLEKGGNAIYVEDQLAESLSVQVGFVILSTPGYVVIYDDESGVPGSVIGSSGLLQDGGEHLVVAVDDPLVNKQVYYAMLYYDDGDGLFDPAKDTQATDSEDSVILMSFLTRSDAAPESEAVSP